jgi:SAM-dependent methyltransferase
MREINIAFDDAAAYEAYMGRWSRAIGEQFLAWLDAPKAARWLDIGCGTGAFIDLISRSCAPKTISGIDPSSAQVDYTRGKFPHADLRVGDAMALPFGDGAFDVVASALVLHFIPDRTKAFAEMKRVARKDGMAAGYTWERTATADFAPYSPMLRGLEAIGAEALRSPTVPEANLDGLQASLHAAGFSDIAVTRIETSQRFRDFDEYWQNQTLTIGPPGKSVAKLDETQRAKLPGSDGSISYAARAVAFKARASK